MLNHVKNKNMDNVFKKIHFIINPKSGKGSKRDISIFFSKYLREKKIEHKISFTQRPNHATQLSKEAVSLNYDLVVAAGGDGTINETAKGLVNTDAVLGIIPLGSGNGYSRHLKIPLKMQDALLSIFSSRCKLVDTLSINDEFFLGIAGIGFDAHIANIFAGSKKRGFWSYARLVISEFFKYEPEKYELFVDGKEMTKEAFLLSFAKSSQYGNNIIIAPNTKLDDGYFNLAILKPSPLYAIFDILLKLKNGNICQSKYYETYSCKEVVIKKKDIKAHLDGEPLLFNNFAKIKIYPKSLKVLMPD